MSLAVKLDETYMYEDYLGWPDDERWELIDGVPYAMSPAPTRWHQEYVGILFNELFNYLNGKPCEVFVAPFDVRLPDLDNDSDDRDDTVKTVVQPDILVVCDESKLDDRGCVGAPDFIIEILSESTAGKDLHEKLMLYEKHGVKEYWIVDMWSRTIRVHLLESDGAYGKTAIYNLGDHLPSAVLKGLKIDLDKLFKDTPRK
jgi:Uma2 family endonuclease